MRTPILAGTSLLVIMLGAGPAIAADDPAPTASLNGCGGTVVTTDKSGAEVSRLATPTAGGASSDTPLVVHYDGRATYQGKSDAVITNHQWAAKVAGITVRTGGSANDGQTTEAAGEVVVSDVMPIKITGLYFVQVSVVGTGGECTGSVWVKLAGNPLATLPFWIGTVLGLLGLAGLWWAWPGRGVQGLNRHPVRGGFAGLFLGLGLIIVLLTTGLAAFSSWWPFLAILIGVPVIGVLVGMAPWLGTGGGTPGLMTTTEPAAQAE